MNKLDMSKEREAFVRHMNDRCAPCFTTNGVFDDEVDDDVLLAWETWLARAQLNSGEWVSVPKGWKLVPVQPTPQMLNAGVNAGVCASPEPWCPAAYRAMLNAAPQPPEEK